MNCERINIIYWITYIKCLEEYAGSATKFKSTFRIHKSDIRSKKDRCATLGTLIINTVLPPIPLYIFVSNSLRKSFVFIMTVVLKIFYGTEKNIDNPNFLQM